MDGPEGREGAFRGTRSRGHGVLNIELGGVRSSQKKKKKKKPTSRSLLGEFDQITDTATGTETDVDIDGGTQPQKE